jgi:hypothetical protein
LTAGLVEFDNNVNYIVLPKEGNSFIMTGNTDIHRINHSTNERFLKGTKITLLFDNANVNILNGAYINLVSSYTSTTNSSLELISMGNGTWRELNRNL